jgi:hypothetical protein
MLREILQEINGEGRQKVVDIVIDKNVPELGDQRGLNKFAIEILSKMKISDFLTIHYRDDFPKKYQLILFVIHYGKMAGWEFTVENHILANFATIQLIGYTGKKEGFCWHRNPGTL